MTRRIRVAVIGAGLGGLTAAAALRQHGIEVMLFERASELGEVGAGIQLGPNAVKVLRALGVEAALRSIACEPVNIVSVAWDDAHQRFREPLKATAVLRFGAPYLTAHRADLHRLLCGLLPSDVVQLGTHCTGTRSSGDSAVVEFADGKQIEADAVVGADGINSTVRESLFGIQPVRFTQQMAWRCIVPIECVPTRVGPQRAVEIGRDEYVGWIGPDGHAICYPIRGGALYNIFAGHVTNEWVERILDGIEQQRGTARGLSRLERGTARHAGPSVRVLQMGYPRSRSAAALDGRRGDTARRCRPSDDADAGARRVDHARGRLCASALHCPA